MEKGMVSFTESIKSGSSVVVFFAGQGVQWEDQVQDSLCYKRIKKAKYIFGTAYKAELVSDNRIIRSNQMWEASYFLARAQRAGASRFRTSRYWNYPIKTQTDLRRLASRTSYITILLFLIVVEVTSFLPSKDLEAMAIPGDTLRKFSCTLAL